MLCNWLESLTWEYGVCQPHNQHARRHKVKGNVQFVLWRAGEQNHNTEYWHNLDSTWWSSFKPYSEQNKGGEM